MMKKIAVVLVLSLLITLLVGGTALADHGEPVGGCPDGFQLHHIEDHDHSDHPHQHVGNDIDQNGDGYLCVKHVEPNDSIHVHIDNNVP